MPETVIRAEGLRKVYPLAASSRLRLLYVLGLQRAARSQMATKAAVDDVDLEIRRGEKVGVIGRNGSGKSTLLGMISGTIEPSAGRLSVDGDINALLQLGAGFNTELTGRDNAYAYLALQGMAGRSADQRVAQIAEFAEIGAYFDQPVKTYSSGMRLRLMFAAATSITPDILILDEVLSVGDAYFIGKSFERMRQISAGEGTTLIVVSHAVNMLTELCDRIVWLDNGAIRMDGEPNVVAEAYTTSVRAEEENRLRKLQASTPIRQLTSLPGANRPDDPAVPPFRHGEPPAGAMTGELRLPDGQPPRHELVVHGLEFRRADRCIAQVPLGAEGKGPNAALLIGDGAGNWGPPLDNGSDSGRSYNTGRAFLPYGSPFHKLPFLLLGEDLRAQFDSGDIEVYLIYKSAEEVTIELRLYADDPPARWRADLALTRAAEPAVSRAALERNDCETCDDSMGQSAVSIGRFGTRRIELTKIDFLGDDGRSRLVYTMGAPFRVRIGYRINDPAFDENAEVVIAFQRDGLQVTHRFFLNEYRFSAAVRREGEILLDATPLLLAPGEYVVSVAVHAAGHAIRKTPREHFTVSHTVYDIYYRCFHITVFEPFHTTLLQDVIFQHPATWIVDSVEFQKSVITD